MTTILEPAELTLHNGIPRVLDLRIAELLEYAQPRDIRKLIGRKLDELERYGKVCATVAQTSPLGGRPGNEYLLNEGQALLICAVSETPKAADARETLIKTFMQYREGRAEPALEVFDATGLKVDITSEAIPVITAKLAMVREARHLWGHERARAIWKQMGLAVPPEDFQTGTTEARDCLQFLLEGEVAGQPIGNLLNHALDGDENAFAILKPAGLWAEPDNDGFVVANRNPALARVMQGTKWEKFGWQPVLRRLPGALPVKPRNYGPSGLHSRGIFIPTSCLDFANQHND